MFVFKLGVDGYNELENPLCMTLPILRMQAILKLDPANVLDHVISVESR